MHIAVCVKQVATREAPVRLNDGRNWVREDHGSWELNEPDAYALEEALRLRERVGGDVVVVSAGPDRVAQVLREALARGADRAIHVSGDHLATADAFTTATALAEALREEAPDLVLTGLQSNDQGFAQVGVALAELLGMPHATIVVAIEIGPNGVHAKRELEGGWFQWTTLPVPALVTVQSGINQLRYATLRGIMASKTKPVKTVQTPHADGFVRVVTLADPGRGRRTTMIGGTPDVAAAELVRRLRDEAGIL